MFRKNLLFPSEYSTKATSKRFSPPNAREAALNARTRCEHLVNSSIYIYTHTIRVWVVLSDSDSVHISCALFIKPDLISLVEHYTACSNKQQIDDNIIPITYSDSREWSTLQMCKHLRYNRWISIGEIGHRESLAFRQITEVGSFSVERLILGEICEYNLIVAYLKNSLCNTRLQLFYLGNKQMLSLLRDNCMNRRKGLPYSLSS